MNSVKINKSVGMKSPCSQLALEFEYQEDEFPTSQDIEPVLEEYLLSELMKIDLPHVAPVTETDISQKWKYSSALQKSIRRGYVNDAVKYAITYHALDPTGFWTRLVVVAFEDIGVGGIQELALTLIAAKSKVWRRKAGGDERVIHYIVKKLAESIKDRSACDYMIFLSNYPRKYKDMNTLRTATLQELSDIALSERHPTTFRASAAWVVAGTDRFENRNLPLRSGSREIFCAMVSQMKIPAIVKYIAMRGMTACRYPMNLLYPFLWQMMQKSLYIDVEKTDFPADRFYIGGLPEEAYDQYVREGKQSLVYFSKACAPVNEWLTSRGIMTSEARIAAIGSAVFITHSAKLNKKLIFEGASEIYDMAEKSDYENAGLSLDDGRTLVGIIEANSNILRQSRIRIVAGGRV